MIDGPRWLVCAALLSCCGLPCVRVAAQAQAEGKLPAAADSDAQLQEARSHFKLGVDLYREGNFRAAIIEFRSAYALRSSYKLLYNLAQTSVELLEYANAMDYLTRYLRDGADQLTPAQQREVHRTMNWLQARMASLRVQCNEAGAEIYLDQTLIGTQPLSAELQVSVGRHILSAKKPGLLEVESLVEVAAGEQRDVRLEFAARERDEVAPPRRPVVAQAPAAPPAQAPPGRSHTLLIWSSITTAAFAAGAVTTSVLTLRSEDQYRQTRRFAAVGNQLNALREDTRTKALVTDILWVATLGSATLATIAWFSGEEESESGHAGRASEHAQVSVTASPSQLSLRGSF